MGEAAKLLSEGAIVARFVWHGEHYVVRKTYYGFSVDRVGYGAGL